MNLFFKKIILFVIHVFLFIQLSAAELNIICTSDLHGQYSKVPALAALIKSFGKDTLRIDVGDTLTGTLFSESRGGAPMISLLNKLNFHFWIPGNHDFELGYQALAARINEFKGTVLGLQWQWKDICPRSWKLAEINGVRAAIIGATDPAMPRRRLPGIDGDFKDTVLSLRKILPDVMAAKPHVIILAYHNGRYSKWGNVSNILKNFPQIDLIIGGHSHQEHAGERIGNAYFVQPGSHGSCIARVKIIIDNRSGRIKQIESGLHYPAPNKIDSGLNTLCRKWQKEERLLAERPIGLKKRERKSLFYLGKLGASALLKETGAEAAVFALYAGRDLPEKRSVQTEGDLYRLLPYNNRICIVELEKSDVEELAYTLKSNSRKYHYRYFTAGALKWQKKGRLVLNGEKVRLAVTDYLLTSIPVLQRKVTAGKSWQVYSKRSEREIMRKALKSADH